MLDASVVLKWFIPEIHSEAARRLLTYYDHQYLAPDLIFAETAHAIWKKARRGEITPVEGRQLVADLESIAVETVPCRALSKDAYALASATGCSAYDAMYLALALRLDTLMITSDQRLLAVLTATPAAALHIQLVEEFQRNSPPRHEHTKKS